MILISQVKKLSLGMVGYRPEVPQRPPKASQPLATWHQCTEHGVLAQQPTPAVLTGAGSLTAEPRVPHLQDEDNIPHLTGPCEEGRRSAF